MFSDTCYQRGINAHAQKDLHKTITGQYRVTVLKDITSIVSDGEEINLIELQSRLP